MFILAPRSALRYAISMNYSHLAPRPFSFFCYSCSTTLKESQVADHAKACSDAHFRPLDLQQAVDLRYAKTFLTRIYRKYHSARLKRDPELLNKLIPFEV